MRSVLTWVIISAERRILSSGKISTLQKAPTVATKTRKENASVTKKHDVFGVDRGDFRSEIFQAGSVRSIGEER